MGRVPEQFNFYSAWSSAAFLEGKATLGVVALDATEVKML
jgi:hypothetical protein